MTTSGTYNFSVNRDQIIRGAMINIEKLDEIEQPSPQDIIDCSFWLNMLMKQWMGTKDFAPGLKTWTRRHGYLTLSQLAYEYPLNSSTQGWSNSLILTTLTAAVSSGSVLAVSSVAGMSVGDNIGVVLDAGYVYWSTIATGGINGLNITINGAVPSNAALGAVVYDEGLTLAQQPLEIITASLRNSSKSDIPLRILTSNQYDALPNKTDPTNIGDPTAIFYDWQLTQGNLYLDVGGAQDPTKYILLTYLEEIQDLNNPAETPEYPPEWFLPLTLGLSKLICPMYHGTWTPDRETNYTAALAIAQKKGVVVETAYFQCGED